MTCTHGAIAINWKTEPDVIQEKIVEYAYGVLKDKAGKAAFITFLNAGHEDSPDKFRALFSNVDWNRQLEYGEKVGLGRRAYRLVKVK